jgi:hypothetical protein
MKLTDFPITFNGSIKVEARPERLTADAGALILRELDERMGWTEFLARLLHDPRNHDFITHPLVELLRTRMYLIAQGWNDQDDADHLRNDPAFRAAVSTRRGDGPLRPKEEHDEEENLPDGLASQPSMSRLVNILAGDHNIRVLHEGLPVAVGGALQADHGHRLQTATLDVDSFPINVHGHQVGSKYNGYYHRRIFHPIVAMVSETEDFVGARLREGNASTAEDLDDFLMPIIDWMEREICVVASVRADAGMPSEPILARLEERKTGYCFRLKSNSVLEDLAKPHLKRPVGGRSKEERVFFKELKYKAGPWSHERRIVLVMIDQPGELYLRYFFLLTNWSEEQMSGEDLLSFYRKRGTHEGHLGEFMNALKVALSCTSRRKEVYGGKRVKKHWSSKSPEDQFSCNEATMLLYVWAYNLANRVRHLVERALPQDRGPSATPNPGGWSLSRVQKCILRVAARFLLHSRRIVVVIGEASASLWNSLAPLIARFPKVVMPEKLHAGYVADG